MIVLVDRIATRYGLLPSEVIDRASTFDLVVMDVTHSWDKMAQDKASGKAPKIKNDTLNLILEKHRESKD